MIRWQREKGLRRILLYGDRLGRVGTRSGLFLVRVREISIP